MSARPRTGAGPSDHAANTLGGLLYANGRALPVPEGDWVALVRSIAAGDQHALRELYGRMHRLVFTLAVRIARDGAAAEEITVDVFHEVWRRAAGYDEADGTVIGWVMNLARSRAIDRLRFEHRQKRAGIRADEALELREPVDASPADGAERALVEAESGRVLRAALSALTPEERRAIETTYFMGLTHVEAAARLGAPLGTIKTRIRSGLAKLRHAFERRPIDAGECAP